MILVLMLLLAADGLQADRRGIPITPDETGLFEYVDDFSTPRFLVDGFLQDLGAEDWTPGQIRNRGPNRGRTLTYRFHGDRALKAVEVRVEQVANGPSLGGHNWLYLSGNGLDWVLAATSTSLEPDAHGWQHGALTAPPELAAAYRGATEIWVRVVLDNSSGLPTNPSNWIDEIRVTLTVGDPLPPGTDPEDALLQRWGALRAQAGWRSIALDCSDPVDQRAPHYYEDADGGLQLAGTLSGPDPEERDGFPVQRALLFDQRPPLALVTFVKLAATDGPLMAQIAVRATRDASRKMIVSWDGAPLATLDTAAYFESDRVFHLEIPAPQRKGTHELRLAGGDSRPILVRRIKVAGAGGPRWATRPPLGSGGSLEALSASYLPDPPPPPASQAVEGRHVEQEAGLIFNAMQRLYREHADFGALRVVVRNRSDVPVRIGSRLRLNGRPIEEHYVDFEHDEWDARGVVWYRVRPQLLPPGACAQVYIRFRRRPAGERADLSIELENGLPLSVSIPYRDPGLSIDYATVDEERDTLYVYVRRAPGAQTGELTRLTLDGERLRDARIYGADFPGHVALAVAKLARPLATGTYHVVGVRTDGGVRLDAQFRVLPWFYPRSSIHVPPELCAEMHMNLAMWYPSSIEACRQYDLRTTAIDPFDQHERVAFIMGPDEPDAYDNRGGGYERGLGYQARRLAHNGWQPLIERFAPHAASWIVMNGTVRPLNWCVYGQLADITCFDPYPINFYGADHAYVRESLELARRCGAPKPLYGCLEAFGWSAGQGVPASRRGPTPAEYRQNVVQALGVGMKGLTSWVYSASAGGWELDEPARREIARCNALIEHIEDDLLRATPIDLAASDAGLVMTGVVGEERWPKERVWVGALLSGPDTLILAVAHHIPASKPDPPRIEPARNVTLTVDLPDYLQQVTAFEATEEGVSPYPCECSDGKARLKLAEIESGRVFLLRRRPSDAERE